MEKSAQKVIGIFAIILIAFGCQDEDPVPIIEQTIIEDAEGNFTNTRLKGPVECEIQGPASAAEGSTFTLTYTTNLINPVVSWTANSPIVLVSNNGTSATFSVVNDCVASARVTATGTDGTGHLCTDFHDITIGQSCPTTLDIDYVCEDAVIAALGGAKGVSSVDWYYSTPCKRCVPSNTYQTTSYNPGCSSVMQTPLYFPASWWDGRTLNLRAEITLIDGSSCVKTKSITLDPC